MAGRSVTGSKNHFGGDGERVPVLHLQGDNDACRMLDSLPLPRAERQDALHHHQQLLVMCGRPWVTMRPSNE
jgi:hypothetical protein